MSAERRRDRWRRFSIVNSAVGMANDSNVAPAQSSRIRVLVAEHKTILREGICRLLESNGQFTIFGTAEDGPTAISLARRPLLPDVLLLEIELPEISGLQVLEMIESSATPVRTVVFGATISAHTAITAFSLGAKGVLQHEESTTLLFRSLRAVANGQYWVRRSLVNQLARHVQSSSKPFQLTTRERDVIALVVAGFGNREIAERCQLSIETIKHHLTRIFAKTGASTRFELSVFALQHGVAGREAADAIQRTDLPQAKRLPRARPVPVSR